MMHKSYKYLKESFNSGHILRHYEIDTKLAATDISLLYYFFTNSIDVYFPPRYFMPNSLSKHVSFSWLSCVPSSLNICVILRGEKTENSFGISTTILALYFILTYYIISVIVYIVFNSNSLNFFVGIKSVTPAISLSLLRFIFN